MAELKWLQGQIPAPDWEKLNERRKATSLKWPELLQAAVTHYLDHVDAGEITIEKVEPEKPAPAPKAEKAKKEKAAPKPKKKTQKGKGKGGKKKAKATKPRPEEAAQGPLSETPTEEDLTELAEIQ